MKPAVSAASGDFQASSILLRESEMARSAVGGEVGDVDVKSGRAGVALPVGGCDGWIERAVVGEGVGEVGGGVVDVHAGGFGPRAVVVVDADRAGVGFVVGIVWGDADLNGE